jgi:hypothetical protein
MTSFLNLSAAEPLRTFDGKHDIRRIQATVVYFVPRDRTALPDWNERVRYFCRRIERFHERELDGQSKLITTVHKEPFRSERTSTALRSGDRDFIFFATLREVEKRLGFGRRQDGDFPVLLVLSDINWRELDDFWRLRAVDGQFEGQIINGRHFPGAQSGGARSLYMPDRGLAWGLVSADGWRVPYSGTDCVVYHEGVGHAIGLPHPEPGNDSVMSRAQYRYWINETWIDDAQKRKLGWIAPPEKPAARTDLFSVFTAVPDPLVPKPGEPVSLRLTWPESARVRACTVRLQTELLGPWHTVPQHPLGPAPRSLSIGTFDRPTPVSYRIDGMLEDGKDVELWGYFQVRHSPAVAPVLLAAVPVGSGPTAARWSEGVDLLALVNMKRDQVAGQWTMTGGRLESNKQYGARLQLPYQPPEEYVLTAIVEPLDEPNGLILGQRSGGNRFLVLVNYTRPDPPPASALENVDGQNVDRNSTTVRAPLLAKNRPSAVVCTVKRDRVTVAVDGRTIIDWRGEPSRLGLSHYWKTPDERAMFVGAYDCRYRFLRLTLAPISGTGKPLVK